MFGKSLGAHVHSRRAVWARRGQEGRSGWHKCGVWVGSWQSGMGNEAQLWGERVCGLRLRKVNGCALELECARVGKG